MRVMFDEVRNNKNKSLLLIFLFIIIIGALGAVISYYFVGDIYVDVWIIGIAILYTAFAYYSGGEMIQAFTGSNPVTKRQYPYLYHTLEGLAIAAGIPTPKAYVIEDSALNAFSTGRDPSHASITVTTGLLNTMDRQELEGVIAHEMSHIQNFDTRFMMLTVVLVGLVTLLSDFLLRMFWWGGKSGKGDRGKGSGIEVILILFGVTLAILSPLIGKLIQLAISREREYAADASAVVLTRYPPGLASALKKIAKDPDPLVDNANKATAHLFISTPFRKDEGLANLFSTHPPLRERIKRLEEM